MNYSNVGIDFSVLIKNEIDKKFGIEVNGVGFQSISPNSLYPLNEHPNGYYFNVKNGRIINEYQFIYITAGCGKLSFSPENEIAISKGQLIVILPGQWHTYEPAMNTGWNEYYIGFEGKMIDNLITNSYLTKENPVFNIELNEELVSLFKRAIEVAKLDRKSTQQHLAGIVMHMIGLTLYESQNRRTRHRKFRTSN